MFFLQEYLFGFSDDSEWILGFCWHGKREVSVEKSEVQQQWYWIEELLGFPLPSRVFCFSTPPKMIVFHKRVNSCIPTFLFPCLSVEEYLIYKKGERTRRILFTLHIVDVCCQCIMSHFSDLISPFNANNCTRFLWMVPNLWFCGYIKVMYIRTFLTFYLSMNSNFTSYI